jgi:hypothetical protein
MKILYVTSFAEDMYNASGKKLLNSFISTKQTGDLLVCYENFNFISEYDNIISYNIGEYGFLLKWLEKFKDIIPEYQGGCATNISCPEAFTPPNRRAARWFRKVAALHYAVNIIARPDNKYDTIIWIDSDCFFNKLITNRLYQQSFNKTGVFYHLGFQRNKKEKGVESGFIGFNKEYYGFDFLDSLFKIYMTGRFKKYPRWDDGYIIKMVINIQPKIIVKYKNSDIIQKIHTNDLIKQDIYSPYINNILSLSIFKDYIIHDKGMHARMNIMI